MGVDTLGPQQRTPVDHPHREQPLQLIGVVALRRHGRRRPGPAAGFGLLWLTVQRGTGGKGLGKGRGQPRVHTTLAERRAAAGGRGDVGADWERQQPNRRR